MLGSDEERIKEANIAFILIIALLLLSSGIKANLKTADKKIRLSPKKPVQVKPISANQVSAGNIPASKPATVSPPDAFHKGMSYPGYNAKVFLTPDSDNEIRHIASTGANAIALVPLWYTTNLNTSDIHAEPKDTVSDASLTHAIRLAHSLGLKVNLKPFVDPKSGGTWRAKYHPANWEEWFSHYTAFIKHYANLAQQNNVEMITIGTEYTSSDGVREANWRKVIAEVRSIYKGKLTYAADYQDIIEKGRPYRGGFLNVRFWDALDYIGIDGYFPLAKKKDESVAQLKADWQKWVTKLENWTWIKNAHKQIIFTEVGYGSYPGTTVDTGHWDHKTTSVDLGEQANAYEALFEVFYTKPWFRGVYWWAWDNPSTFDWKPENRKFFFTPKGKPAEGVLRNWYKNNKIK